MTLFRGHKAVYATNCTNIYPIAVSHPHSAMLLRTNSSPCTRDVWLFGEVRTKLCPQTLSQVCPCSHQGMGKQSRSQWSSQVMTGTCQAVSSPYYNSLVGGHAPDEMCTTDCRQTVVVHVHVAITVVISNGPNIQLQRKCRQCHS